MTVDLLFGTSNPTRKAYVQEILKTPSSARLARSPLASLEVNEAAGRYEAELSHEERAESQVTLAAIIRGFVAKFTLGENAHPERVDRRE